MGNNLYMDNYTKQFQSESPNLVSAVDCQASLRAIHDKVITTADFVDGSHIYAARPPKGWKWSGRSLVNHGALGTGVTLSMGVDATAVAGGGIDPAKFLAAVDCTAAGVKTCNVPRGIGYKFDGETIVIITIGGADCVANIDIITEFEFYAVN